MFIRLWRLPFAITAFSFQTNFYSHQFTLFMKNIIYTRLDSSLLANKVFTDNLPKCFNLCVHDLRYVLKSEGAFQSLEVNKILV